ncbi:MAG: hypothetical protein KDD43_06780 [Bdellovibrionales bacterium]|nr:hypothetical protein [Bdellovibrionales bacterium]
MNKYGRFGLLVLFAFLVNSASSIFSPNSALHQGPGFENFLGTVSPIETTHRPWALMRTEALNINGAPSGPDQPEAANSPGSKSLVGNQSDFAYYMAAKWKASSLILGQFSSGLARLRWLRVLRP